MFWLTNLYQKEVMEYQQASRTEDDVQKIRLARVQPQWIQGIRSRDGIGEENLFIINIRNIRLD